MKKNILGATEISNVSYIFKSSVHDDFALLYRRNNIIGYLCT
jgi:hypothetical protein